MSAKHTFHFISHTHWDREWYLTFEQFRYRLVMLVDRLLDLLDRNEDFKYFHLDGQTIVLEDYYALRPENKERLEAYIRSGRILIGPWYQQNDLFLTSGESTIRNLMEGIRTSRSLGGEMKVGYLPDHFGLIGQMPQLFVQAGIDNSIFGRGLDIDSHESPFVIWRSPDGSEVTGILLYYWYNSAQRLPNDPEALRLFFEQLHQREMKINPSGHYAMMNGVDHLEAQYDLPEVLDQLRESFGSTCEFVHDTLPDYANAIKEYVKSLGEGQTEVVQGELRECFEYSILSGTLSSRVYIKQANLVCHDLLEKWLEPLSAWAAMLKLDAYDAGALNYLWNLYMECHPHDSICGCSQDAVHDQMMDRFQRVETLAKEIIDRKLQVLSSVITTDGYEAGDIMLYTVNASHLPNAAVQQIIVEFLWEDQVTQFAIEDSEGNAVPFRIVSSERVRRQVLSPINLPGVIDVYRYVIEWQPEIAAFGYAAYRVRPHMTGAQMMDAVPSVEPALENEYLRVDIRPDGTFDVTQKATGHVLRGQGRFEDMGDRGDLYVFSTIPGDVRKLWSSPVEVVERIQHALYQSYTYRFTWTLPAALSPNMNARQAETEACTFEVTLRLDRGAEQLDMKVKVVNRVKDHRLRILFPSDQLASRIIAGGQLDAVERQWDTGKQWKRDANGQPFWKWVAAERTNSGAAVFAKGLHEYEMINEGKTMAITLLRSVETIHLRDAVPMVEDRQPKGQCLGEWTFELSLRPFSTGAVSTTQLYREAERFHQGMLVKQRTMDPARWNKGRAWVQAGVHSSLFLEDDPNADKTRMAATDTYMNINGEVLVSALKRAVDSEEIMLRVYNVEKHPALMEVKLARPVERIQLCSFLEELVEEEGSASSIQVGMKKINTYAIKL